MNSVVSLKGRQMSKATKFKGYRVIVLGIIMVLLTLGACILVGYTHKIMNSGTKSLESSVVDLEIIARLESKIMNLETLVIDQENQLRNLALSLSDCLAYDLPEEVNNQQGNHQ